MFTGDFGGVPFFPFHLCTCGHDLLVLEVNLFGSVFVFSAFTLLSFSFRSVPCDHLLCLTSHVAGRLG